MKWACLPQPHPFRNSKLLLERKDTLLLTLALQIWPPRISFLCKMGRMVNCRDHLMDHLPKRDSTETPNLEDKLWVFQNSVLPADE